MPHNRRYDYRQCVMVPVKVEQQLMPETWHLWRSAATQVGMTND